MNKKEKFHPLNEFKKEHIPWNKGLTILDERVRKWHEKCTNTQNKLFRNKELVPWNKGKKTGFISKTPEKTRKKISNMVTNSYKNGRVGYFKGILGNLHPKWKGKNCIKKQERNDSLYINWTQEVKKRDSNTCQLKNKKCSGYNIVHHIYPWSKYPELRYNINNGITLCQFHHPTKRKDEIKLIPILKKLVR